MLSLNSEQLQVLFLLIVSRFPQGVSADMLLSAMYQAQLATPLELSELIEQTAERGLVTFTEPQKTCRLSEVGCSILEEAKTLLSEGVRKDALSSVLRAYDELLGKSVYAATVEKVTDGAVLSCTETVGKSTIASLSLHFDSEKSAVLAKHRFDKNPKGVWNAIRAVLTGDADFLL